MCIRDRKSIDPTLLLKLQEDNYIPVIAPIGTDREGSTYNICLLYTSDAADERSSVDLGGRRIIKKKNNRESDGNRGE